MKRGGYLRTFFLACKLIKIHGLAYGGLWIALGAVVSAQAKVLIAFCASDYAKRHTEDLDVCKNDISAETETMGAVVFSAALIIGLFGAIFSNIAFVRMLHATDHRLERVAHCLHMDRSGGGMDSRLLQIGDGGPWFGIMLQLIVEQLVIGIPATLYYATLPSMIALGKLLCQGHRMKYVSADRS
jgi:hypothetical protein